MQLGLREQSSGVLSFIQGGNSEKNIRGAKGEKCGPFWPRRKMWTFCGQLSAEAPNSSAKGTKAFSGVRGQSPRKFMKTEGCT